MTVSDSSGRAPVEPSGAVDETELLPCPFCGAEAEIRFSFGAEWVECTGCNVEVACDTFAEAIANWNTREAQLGASDSQPQRATESPNERWAAYLSMEREAQAARRATEWTAIESAFEAEIELIAPDQRAVHYYFWKRMKARVDSVGASVRLPDAAIARVSKFLAQRALSRGLDQEQIAGLHVGDNEREALLTASDLRALIAVCKGK